MHLQAWKNHLFSAYEQTEVLFRYTAYMKTQSTWVTIFLIGLNAAVCFRTELLFKLNITTVLLEPFIFDQFDRENNSRRVGVIKDVLDVLDIRMKFAYEIYVVPDGNYGAPDANRVWNGMVGEVLYGRADIAAADLTVTASRSKVISFSVPYMNVELGLIFKTPTVEFDLFAFFLPFSTSVWCLILGSIFLISITLFIFSIVLKNDEDPLRNVSACFYFGIACLLAQGPETYPRSLFSRVTAISWWFLSLMIITLYTASLTSTLTLNRAKLPLQKIEDLIYQDEMSYGIEDYQILEELFRESQYPPFQVMWEHMIRKRERSFYSPKTGLEKVRSDENFAFIQESPYVQHAVATPPCDLDYIISCNSPRPGIGFGFAFPKDSNLVSNFSVEILNMYSSGKWQQFMQSGSKRDLSAQGANLWMLPWTKSGFWRSREYSTLS